MAVVRSRPFGGAECRPSASWRISPPLSQNESDATIAPIEAHFDQHGFGYGPWTSWKLLRLPALLGCPSRGVRNPISRRVSRLAGGLRQIFGEGAMQPKGRRPLWPLGFPSSALSRLCRLPYPRQCGVVPSDGDTRNDADPERRLRSPAVAGGPSVAASRALSSGELRLISRHPRPPFDRSLGPSRRMTRTSWKYYITAK